jgi:hypothetical protein
MSSHDRVLLGKRGVADLPPGLPSEAALELAKAWAVVANILPQDFDIIEVRNAPPKAKELSRTVALVTSSIDPQGAGKWTLKTERIRLLAKEKFAGQDSVPFSQTGFLVAEDLLLTTVHDLNLETLLRNFKVVFDFKLNAQGKTPTEFTDKQVFAIKSVVAHGNHANNHYDDWLLLRLKPTGRTPLLSVAKSKPDLGSGLWMIGHPFGLPMKFVNHATVKKVGDLHFETDLDAAEGNSGSIVTDTDGKSIVGVLQDTASAKNPAKNGYFTWWWCQTGGCHTDVTTCTTFVDRVQTAIEKPAWAGVLRAWDVLSAWFARVHRTAGHS